MIPSETVRLHRDAVLVLARAHNLADVRVFGSAARGEDRAGSDLDLLVVPLPDTTTLFDLVDFKADVERLLGVPVDVRTAEDLHPRFRSSVVSEAITL
ncbi:nucleotidyltransferase family protein [Roseospira navarrensis]|uniref:Nucleotidyltransferase n=1 Tax=Roseospira navarrensis TaxID=140058 RepID=A0A7X1ZDA3_9PROT|nr:nucleotidyltransferase family protein [Roseospira navarrensis]MQX35282.1 nucleotidyltransferase [Roseospira navarrensis]